MNQRERQAPDGGASTTSCAGAGRPVVSPPSGPVGASSLLEEWYRHASASERQEVLGLAGLQGVVYAHQLRASGTVGGTAPASVAPLVARGPLLPSLLAGSLKGLEPSPLPSFDATSFADPQLDDAQRLAVLQAIHVPDVCLIQGYPGTGKSRVVAELLHQAARRGERVLFVAPSPAALDRPLERLARSELAPVRCLAAGEALEGLPESVRRLTLVERVRHFREATLPAARQAARAAREACEASRRQEAVWPRFEALLAQQARLDEQARALDQQRASLSNAVEAELSGAATNTAGTAVPIGLTSIQARWAEYMRQRDEAVARLDAGAAESKAETEKVRAGQTAAEAERGQLRLLVEARQARRWWAPVWWRAMFQADLLSRCEQAERRCQELEQKRGGLARAEEERQSRRTALDVRAAEERQRLCAEEVARRQAELEAQAKAGQDEQARAEANWQIACRELGPDTPAPERTREALERARAAWAARLERDERQATFAAQWAEVVEQALPTLSQRLLAGAAVVAAPVSVGCEAPFPVPASLSGQSNGSGPAFDLLVLEEAHLVPESDLLALSRRARRWVLVGEPVGEGLLCQDEAPPAPPPLPVGRGGAPQKGPRRGAPTNPMRPAAPRPGAFRRLWSLLHADPRRLPSGWAQRDGRLVCRLRPIRPEEQSWVEVEHLADRPDIELRIVAAPRLEPHLAEVLFPAEMPLPEAKDYIYRELQALTVQALGAGLRWLDRPGKVVLDLSGPGGSGTEGAVVVALEEGVRELVAPVPCSAGQPEGGASRWHTCCLEFDREAGWGRERAERWAEERLHLRDLGRTAALAVPYRSRGGLASFLADLLYAGACHPHAQDGGWPGAVELVPVPLLGGEPEGRRPSEREARWGGGGTATAPRLRAPRGGAGLEIDLADAPRAGAIPPDVRAALPAQGLVNYAEAQAVVQALVALLDDRGLQAASAEWEKQGGGPSVAVMALYPAQVELIRALVRRAPELALAKASVEVGLPSTFRQRECLVALVSLTRSHTHRAVTYGAAPQDLVQALTRPAVRLVLFGDLGTLARRSQWQAPLDHLDDAASRREQALLAELVNYVQGHGSHPAAFRLREGSV